MPNLSEMESNRVVLLDPPNSGNLMKKPIQIVEKQSLLLENRVSSDQKIPVAKTGCRRYLGIGLALSSSLVFSLSTLLVKMLPHYHPYSVTFWRFAGGILIPMFPIMLFCRWGLKMPIFDSLLPICAPGNPKTWILISVWKKFRLKLNLIMHLKTIIMNRTCIVFL